MPHHCHATGCTVLTTPELFMCLKHWRMLPKRLQKRIWETYRRGQCDDWEPSAAYCDAAIEAVTWLAQKEGIEPDISLYEVFRPEKEGLK